MRKQKSSSKPKKTATPIHLRCTSEQRRSVEEKAKRFKMSITDLVIRAVEAFIP